MRVEMIDLYPPWNPACRKITQRHEPLPESLIVVPRRYGDGQGGVTRWRASRTGSGIDCETA